MNDLDKIFDSIQDLTNKFKNRRKTTGNQGKQPHFLIVGLGNPGREYKDTRHNIGFQTLDHLAHRLGVSFSKQKSKAMIAQASYFNQRILLAKPQTYMNKSGFAVRSLSNYYHIPTNHLLIIYDDVDLPLGTLRIKPKGGSGGHKGMKSILDQFGTQEIPRLRIGIGRPPGKKQAADYVLKGFHPSEIETKDYAIIRATDAILEFVTNGIETAMTKYNRDENNSNS